VCRPIRFSKYSIEALREAAQAYAVAFFEKINIAAAHAKRATPLPRDVALIKKLCDGHFVLFSDGA
jgi:histone H3/H4